MKILVAVDGSEQSNQALLEVARRPWPAGSEIRAVTAYQPAPPFIPEVLGMTSPESYTLAVGHSRKAALAIAERAKEVLATELDQACQVTADVIEGEPREAIIEEADKWGADLIVLGAMGHGALSRFLLGSVSSAVAQHARCSVEIVRPRA